MLRRRFLFEELVKRDFKKKYKRTVLGMGWSLLSPLLMLLVMKLVFTQFFGRNTPHYTTCLFCGNMVFTDYLVVGSGLYGCTFAREMTDKGRKCLVIDGRPQLGGNVYCEDVDGVTVHKYGPHIFHTDDEDIMNYVNQYVSFVPYGGDYGEAHQGVPKGGYSSLIEGLLKGFTLWRV